LTAFSLLLTGCASSPTDGGGKDVPADNKIDAAENYDTTAIGQTEDAQKISPLPDTTMENLMDAILSVSLEEGDA
jgi:hypothetical protein